MGMMGKKPSSSRLAELGDDMAPEAPGSDADMSDDSKSYDEADIATAQEFLDAVKGGDAEALLHAMAALKDAC